MRRVFHVWLLLPLLLAGCAGDGSAIPLPAAPACSGVEPRYECIQEFVWTPSCAVSGSLIVCQ